MGSAQWINSEGCPRGPCVRADRAQSQWSCGVNGTASSDTAARSVGEADAPCGYAYFNVRCHPLPLVVKTWPRPRCWYTHCASLDARSLEEVHVRTCVDNARPGRCSRFDCQRGRSTASCSISISYFQFTRAHMHARARTHAHARTRVPPPPTQTTHHHPNTHTRARTHHTQISVCVYIYIYAMRTHARTHT